MYWEIGKLLYDKKLDSKHGDKVVKRLSADLKAAYPKMGMSERNLWDMKRFYVRFKDSESKLRQAIAVLPWWNINTLISKFGDDDEAIQYYAEQTVEKQWDRDLMVNAINMGMHTQLPVTNTSNNFALTLPYVQAAYANEILFQHLITCYTWQTRTILRTSNSKLSTQSMISNKVESRFPENRAI